MPFTMQTPQDSHRAVSTTAYLDTSWVISNEPLGMQKNKESRPPRYSNSALAPRTALPKLEINLPDPDDAPGAANDSAAGPIQVPRSVTGDDLMSTIVAIADGIATLQTSVDATLDCQRAIIGLINQMSAPGDGPVAFHGDLTTRRERYAECLKEDHGYITC